MDIFACFILHFALFRRKDPSMLPGLFLGKPGEGFITSRDWHAGTSSSFCSLRISHFDVLGMSNSFLTTFIYGRTLMHYIYYIAIDYTDSIRSLASSFTSTFADVSYDVTTFQSSVWRLEETILQIQHGPFNISLSFTCPLNSIHNLTSISYHSVSRR